MIITANCKINIGLRITEKREDGYHNLSTLFYPVNSLFDIVEIVKSDTLRFSDSGIAIDGATESNLCVKAFNAFNDKYGIKGAAIHLHKSIPFGAGLGGGSSDAAAVIRGLNTLYEVGASDSELCEIAILVGSDVPFFIHNKPMYGEGRGDILSPFDIDLSGWHITIIKPNYGVSTKEAYSKIKPCKENIPLTTLLKRDINEWSNLIVNDFETSVFNDEMHTIKNYLYSAGAIYVAMSGSGSAIFALSREKLHYELDNSHFIHQSQL